MIYFKYLDIPQIPESIIPTKQELLDLPLKEKTNVPRTFPFFVCKHTTNLVNDWVQDTLKIKTYTQFQFIYPNIPKNIDRGRNVTLNYILYTGGNDVATNFFSNDRQQLLHSEIITEKSWHTILTCIVHNVTNIDPNDVRIAIGCQPVDEKQFMLEEFNIGADGGI